MLKQSALVLLLMAFPFSALSSGAIKTQQVHFAPDKSNIIVKGTIEGSDSISYLIGAEAGQTLSLTLKASNASTYFNLYEPGQGPGGQALARSEMIGDGITEINNFRGPLLMSGIYTVNVFLFRAAARRNKISHFQLDVALAGQVDVGKRHLVVGDFADSLQGGPDFWKVTGVGQSTLTLYRDPSASSARVERLAEGSVLRNRGCRIVTGTRWCKVELQTKATVVGWVQGAYLRESAPPSDALVPGTAFHATGTIPCAMVKGQPMMSCRFGVTRLGLGKANVTVFLARGEELVIRFDNGVPSGSDAPAGARLSFSKQADLFLISINAARFEIPEAVINGG